VLGAAATMVAGLAAMATSAGGPLKRISLPDQPVALSQSAAAQSFRFRVETNSDMVGLEATLTMEAAVTPVLSITPIDGGNSTLSRLRSFTEDAGFQSTGLRVTANLDCSEHLPCTVDFEALCTAQTPLPDVTSGTLVVTTFPVGGSFTKGEQQYLAIEPL
jgi:hypothetical protein